MPFDQVGYQVELDPEIRENLRRAKKSISNPSDWLKVGPAAKSGYLCAIMACGYANRNYHTAHLAVRALERALPPGFTKVPVYNDHRDTTHADIMALFDRAIGDL